MNSPRIRRSLYGLAAFGTLLAAGGTFSLVTSAQQSPPSPTQAKKAIPDAPLPITAKQTVLSGNTADAHSPKGASVSGHDPKNQGLVTLHDATTDNKTGIAKGKDVVYTEGDMKFTGMSAIYNTNSRELDTQGNLELDDPKHHVTGDKSHVDRKKQLAIIQGNVIITLKPTPPDPNIPVDPDAAKQRKYPVIITCDRADDSYKKDFIVLNGHLVFKQTIVKDNGKTVERTLTAEHAEYDGQSNQLHLFQPVKAYDSEGQNWDFEKDAFVGTKEGEETLTSPGKSTVRFNPDDATDDDVTKADKSPTDKKTEEKKPPEKKDTPPPPVLKPPN